MSHDLTLMPEYKATMERLEQLKRTSEKGVSYWLAREIMPALGYLDWRNFTNVIDRARAACGGVGIDGDKHIVATTKMSVIGNDAQREVEDFFLSRPAAYLLALNGDPSKAEIAAAQTYFAIQTRRMEVADARTADEKRVEQRDKTTVAFKRVSGVAKKAGVPNERQALFHDARHQGLYDGLSAPEVRKRKGIPEGENPFNVYGALELSTHEFQMNLAADVITREGIEEEGVAIQRNLEVARDVRETIKKAGGTPPIQWKIEEPISAVKKRLKPAKAAKAVTGPPAKPRKPRAKKAKPSSRA
jgi:DNA-damage-inducible protein D